MPSWLPRDLDVSDSSSDDDETERPPEFEPPHALPPIVWQDVQLQAAWDLLHRPAGISVRRLVRTYEAVHGLWPCNLMPRLYHHPWLHFFQPAKTPVHFDTALPPWSEGSLLLRSVSRFSTRREQGAFVDPFVDTRPYPSGILSWHVRRSPPVDVRVDETLAAAASRLRAAAASLGARSSREEAARVAAPLVFAGAAYSEPDIPPVEQPSAFSHRRLDCRPDAESLLCAFPVCNVVPTTQEDPGELSRKCPSPHSRIKEESPGGRG